jgi:ABC-type Fe3+-hydroxamate transport system substrate-binding protein
MGIRWLIAGMMILICVQTGGSDYPREVTDSTGAAITIPARPQIVAVIGAVSLPALVVPPENLRRIDPAAGPVDWQGVGLLIAPEGVVAAYPALLEAGVPVFQMGTIRDLDGWRRTVAALGWATGQEDRASAVIRQLNRRLALVRERVQGRAPVRVLVLTPEGYTFGRGTLITGLIAWGGGINVAAAAGLDDYRQVDDSLIRELAPDVILLTSEWGADGPALFMSNPAYAGIPAVQNGRVIRLPFSATQPADPGAAVWMLARVIGERSLSSQP